MDKEHNRMLALWMVLLGVGLAAAIGWVIPGWMELATAHKPAEKHAEGLPPLAELMPLLEARPTTNGMWHIWLKAHNERKWSENTIDIPTEAMALDAIADIKLTLRIRYETGKTLVDALGRK